MSELMDLATFRSYRDRFALDNMLRRGQRLEVESAEAWKEVQRLKRWRSKLAQFNIGTGLQYGLTKEQFDTRMRVVNLREKLEAKLDEAYRKWALIEAEIGTIVNDKRYIEWMEAQQLSETA